MFQLLAKDKFLLPFVLVMDWFGCNGVFEEFHLFLECLLQILKIGFRYFDLISFGLSLLYSFPVVYILTVILVILSNITALISLCFLIDHFFTLLWFFLYFSNKLKFTFSSIENLHSYLWTELPRRN